MEHEINYSAKFITIGEIKARIKELTERHKYGQPEEDADQEIWDQWEELQALQDVEHDLNWCWDEDNKTLIHTDKFDEFAQEECLSLGLIEPGCFLIDLIDWDKAADNLLQDYKRVNLPDGNDYWTRA